MGERAGERVRSVTKAAGLVAVLAVGALACGTLLGVDPDGPEPVPDGGSGVDGSPPAADGAALGDAAVVILDPADVQAPDPSDGAPPISIPHDATADVYNPPGCPEAVDCERVVFVSSVGVLAATADPPAADAYCTALAAAATAHPRIANRKFLGWTSDGMSSPSARFVKGTKPYIRPNGAVIASNWSDLTDGTIQRSIFHDERGASVAAPARIWTGTATDGTALAPHCLNWTLSDNGTAAIVGALGATNAGWTNSSVVGATCDEALLLYCFEK